MNSSHKILGMFLLAVLLILFAGATAPRAADEPGAPSALKLQIQGKGFLLNWKASPDQTRNVTGYEIARATMASGPFETVGRVGKDVLHYYDLKANPENIYFYKVRSIAGGEYSAYSNTVTGELPGY